MEIFVNECSLHQQYFSANECKIAFQVLHSILNKLDKHRLYWKICTDEDLFQIFVKMGEPFSPALNSLRDKSLREAIVRVLFNQLNAKEWEKERQHSAEDEFTCEQELITNTSMAELAERTIQGLCSLSFLLNFAGSKFAGSNTINVFKNGETSTALECLDDSNLLERWLELRKQMSQFEYSYSSSNPPTDRQTILRNSKRFSKTNLHYDGRVVYREIQTALYWYVDNLHFNEKAHFEVFDSKGRHVGEADLMGKISKEKQDPQKKLQI